MNDPQITAKLNATPLPEGYVWGDWSGDYRIIKRGGREVCRVGGVAARVSPNNLEGEVLYAIAKGERELAR